jgi:hypothetical protein
VRHGLSPNRTRNISTAPSAAHEDAMLLRRVLIGLVAVAVATAGCGRQITPDRLYADGLSGKMLIDFRINGQLDLTDYNYVIVFNTCGTGGEPYPNTYATTNTNYSYVFAVGANYGPNVLPSLFQYLVNGNNTLNPRPVSVGSSTTQLVLDESGNGNDFQIIFTRAQLDNPLQVVNPCPFSTPQPGATGVAQNVPGWYINFFTIDTTGRVQDSLGVNCENDTSFLFKINTAISTQNALPVHAAGFCSPTNPSAQVQGGEIDSYQ